MACNNIFSYNSSRLFLRDLLESRVRVNRAYSLRAFSRDLNIPLGRLSEFLSSKSNLSFKNIEKVAGSLNLNYFEYIYFYQISSFEKSKQIQEKVLPSDNVLSNFIGTPVFNQDKILNAFANAKLLRNLAYTNEERTEFRTVSVFENLQESSRILLKDDFMQPENKFICSAYFIYNEDTQFYESYLDRALPAPGQIELINPQNLQLSIEFSKGHLPTIKNLTLAYLHSKSYVQATIRCSMEKFEIDGSIVQFKNKVTIPSRYKKVYKRI